METFDLLGAIALGGSAIAIIAVPAAWYARGNAGRFSLAMLHLAWLAAVVALGATGALSAGALGTPGLGLTVALPTILVIVATLSSPALRSAFAAIPTEVLVGLNVVRLDGVFFVLLYGAHRLPAPFAPSAGWGDIAIGAAALPLAWAIRRGLPGWRGLALLWNILGLADLVSAIGLGVTSAEGSPVRLFFGEPSTAIMTDLPWVLIPAFLVPTLFLSHLAIFGRLISAPKRVHGVA